MNKEEEKIKRVIKRREFLEAIEDGMDELEDLLFMFFPPYGYTRARWLADREKRNIEKIQKREKRRLEERMKLEKQRFASFIYKLKKENLVQVKNDKIFLTNKGKRYLRNKKEYRRRSYEVIEGNELNLVIFDIPEKERGKRDWLREVLRNMKYKQLQKSVWMGRNKLPQQFLEDLLEMNLHRYVEIFAISKKGTLERVKI